LEFVRIVRMNTRVTLVVQLRDAAAGGPPVGPLPIVRLAGVPKLPYARTDGSYVFSDLDAGEYRLEIESLYYFRIERAVSVAAGQTKAAAIVPIALTPLPSYPFGLGDTVLRLTARDAAGRPLKHAQVTAAVLSEESAPYRLAQDEAAAGDTAIAVAPGALRIGPGDRFTLKARGASTGEIVEVAATDTGKRLMLASPLNHTYPRGALLLPLFGAVTTAQGEAAVALYGCRSKTFQVALDIRSEDGALTAAQTIEAADGQARELGTITLS
jgi:hypothetical protein